jgi:hypothetical protein
MTNGNWEDRADDGDGLFAIACGLQAVATALLKLGLGTGTHDVGAIEGLGMHLGDSAVDQIVRTLGADKDA